MKIILATFLIISGLALQANAEATPVEKKFYRDMILRIRTQAEFKIPMPANGDMPFNYKLEFDQPKWKEIIVSDLPITGAEFNRTGKFFRNFWDKIFLKEGSYLEVGGERIPLTCIHVAGQDNRFSGKTGPLLPDFILKIIFVANDWTCSGPLNPGWPENGGKKEAWESYVHYEVRDPTIMLPVEAGLRFRWNEFAAVLVK